MRKILSFIMTMVVLFSITACSQIESKSMSIKKSEFSEETSKVLKLFNGELEFFDVKLDETAKSYNISTWEYRDGKWDETGQSSGEIDLLDNQIGINISETTYELFLIDENGHSSYRGNIDTDFGELTTIASTMISIETPIELNKEIPLWVKIATNDESMSVMDITEDFRDNKCDAGVAVTLTISDEVLE